MSLSSETGAEVFAASNGLDLLEYQSSSDEYTSELVPSEHDSVTRLEPGTIVEPPRDTASCEGGSKGPSRACRDADVETVAVYMCTTVETEAVVSEKTTPWPTPAGRHKDDPPAKTLHCAAGEHQICTGKNMLRGEGDEEMEHNSDSPEVTAPRGRNQLPSDMLPKGQESNLGFPQSQELPQPPHAMAQVHVKPNLEREMITRGMQDSKSLDEISQACRGPCGRGGHPEGRRATISSALELEGTVSHDGDLTHFIARNLEHKIKMSCRVGPDSDLLDRASSELSATPWESPRALPDIPPIDPNILLDLQRQTQAVGQSVDLMMRGLSGTVQNMTALSVGYIQTYRDSVDSVGEAVDMGIKGMYTLMARCEELDRSMQPINLLAKQIHDIKHMLDTLEALCK